MADTTLHLLRCNEEDYFLITDNGGQNGMVYQITDRLSHKPVDSPSFGQYDEGVVWRNGTILGPATVNLDPLPDRRMAGYPAVKRNSTAVFRYLTENN